ncbi:hypothetical protein [Streptomyces violaceusniger]|nr:hypothetical protein [Streptomyces hygroscopicus]
MPVRPCLGHPTLGVAEASRPEVSPRTCASITDDQVRRHRAAQH